MYNTCVQLLTIIHNILFNIVHNILHRCKTAFKIFSLKQIYQPRYQGGRAPFRYKKGKKSWERSCKYMTYLVGPYYAGPKSTPAHFTPALIPPRANFDLPPFRAAFNATIWKNQKNQKKGKVFNLE